MLPAGWLRRFDGTWARERPLAPLTTWRIGGPAQLFLEPAGVAELGRTVRELWRCGLPYRLLGGGSNILVDDRGVRGAVVSLDRLDRIGRCRTTPGGLVADAGAHLHTVVRFAARHGLSGAEPLAGIPGRVGGAIFGNAGGKRGDIGSLVRYLDLLEPDGELVRVAPGEGFFRYRGSLVGRRVVVRAILGLEEGEPHAARQRSLEIMKDRRSSQPGWIGNAGCVFKNPPGDNAGRLIDASGCKGMREGGIVVSDRHANFFENHGGGTSDDVRRLADRVRCACGADLELEVRRWP